jgi:hypothetical protein
MADRDKMLTGLKITTKAGIILQDTASIAGVYNNSDHNEEEDNENKEEDDDFDDEMNPNDIGEILPFSNITRAFIVPEYDDYVRETITNDNDDNGNTNENEDDYVTESVQFKIAMMRIMIKEIQEILHLIPLKDLQEYPHLM